VGKNFTLKKDNESKEIKFRLKKFDEKCGNIGVDIMGGKNNTED